MLQIYLDPRILMTASIFNYVALHSFAYVLLHRNLLILCDELEREETGREREREKESKLTLSK